MTEVPNTRDSLAADLRAIGVRPAMNLIAHSSLSAIGWTVNGARDVVAALLDVLGPDGTLMMPAFSGQLTDPAGWREPPVPESWHDTIRAHMEPFDPILTPTRNMGAVVEAFRHWPGTCRSHHPVMSLAVRGRHAEMLTASHPTPWALGNDSPMGRFHGLDGHILLIGVWYNRNSSLHLAETRATHRRTMIRRTPTMRDGKLAWEDNPDVAADLGTLFPRIGTDFEAAGHATIGQIGQASSRLMRQRVLVDFATAWLDRELAPAAAGD
jgi:aminoglycoside 3-N-acetyltransferase